MAIATATIVPLAQHRRPSVCAGKLATRSRHALSQFFAIDLDRAGDGERENAKPLGGCGVNDFGGQVLGGENHDGGASAR